MQTMNGSGVDIEYAYERKFKLPAEPDYSIGGSILSILSLAFMTALSAIMYLHLRDPSQPLVSWGWLQPPESAHPLAMWTWLPFAFTIFGAGLGFLFELGLLLGGMAFQQARTKMTRFVVSIRLLNLAPVTCTILFFVCCMTMVDPSLRTGALFVAGGLVSILGFGLFFGGAHAIPLLLMGMQIVQILLVLTFGVQLGGSEVAMLLIGQSVVQLIALKIGTATPLKSTGFHTLSTIAGLLLYFAIVIVTNKDATFSHSVAIGLPPGSLMRWGFVATIIAGLFIASRAFPNSLAVLRMALSDLIWSPLYFMLVSQPRFGNPHNLSEIYNREGTPKKLIYQPYFMQHPQNLRQPLSIPSPESMEANVSIFKKLVKKVKGVFSLISLLDHVFPQANVNIPLNQKPRLPIWSGGAEYWPVMFTWKLFGLTIPGRRMDPTPEPVIEAYKRGQLLAFLTLSGVASPFARPETGKGQGALVSDFRYLEAYESKPDYHGYGGLAHFQVNAQTRSLDLVSVVAPGSTDEIAANPNDPAFRKAESLVLASIYYAIISGKHLGEIHMTYNLVESSLHNAFDAQGQWNHPFRTVLYLHLFAHELAEELTTEHLVQDGAVFAQVFATTQDSLIDHLNDVYRSFEYGEDENFEARKAAMTMFDADGNDMGLLPDACIAWELDYAQIWQKYADRVVSALYANDDEVRADIYLQNFYNELLALIPGGLPDRYEKFESCRGVSRYLSDTIHHLVIRHQVYGTTGVRAAIDPRISSTQVPRDGGPPAIDEWRSLACVALATGAARFTLLMGDFDYLIKGVDSRYVDAMRQAFETLQKDLHELNAKWTETDTDRQYNYDYFRAIPGDLHTGPGY